MVNSVQKADSRYHTICLIAWSTVLLEKLTFTDPVKKFLPMEPKSSLLFSQEPTTCPYREPDESSPQLPTQFP